MTDSDLPPDLPKDESPLPPPPTASRPGKSGWRVAAGVILCIVTLLLTLAMLPFSFCFGIMLQSSSNSSDAPWIIGFIILNILVPVGGTMLAIRIFRGPKSQRAAAGVAGEPAASAPVPRASAKEIEEKLAYLRLVILVVILAHAAMVLLGFARNPKNIAVMIVPSLLSFVLYQGPYFAVLLGIRQRAESWALSLAFMYSIFSPFFTAIYFLASPLLWRYSQSSALLPSLLYSLTVSLAGAAANAVVAVFAWRTWQAAGRGSDSAAQMTLWGAVSAIYLLLLHFSTSLLYRYVHF